MHGAAFTTWIVLLLVQTSLASAGPMDVHQRLGMAGTDLLRRDGGDFEVNAQAFYAGTLGDMVVFGTLLFAACRARFKPAAHKRLILVATITPARATH